MIQSFLHILPTGEDPANIIAQMINDYKWSRDPEVYNGKEIKVKEMRDFIVYTQKKPLDDVGINIVITSAELISPNVANTMLKIMEEPPPYLSFHLMTDNPHRILPTILSRCHRVHHRAKSKINIAPSSHEKLFDKLQSIKGAAKEDDFKDYLSGKERQAIVRGEWKEAREIDRVLNLYGTTNVSISLALERIVIAQKADIDTPEK